MRRGSEVTAARWRSTAAGQRTYKEQDVERLSFIRHARKLGFSIDETRSLLSVKARPDQSCDEAGDIALRHLRAVDERISRLQALRSELRSVVAACTGGEVSECKIIETLSRNPAASSAGR